jgi:hypothetical protein
VGGVFGGHHSDKLDQFFNAVMVEEFDKFLILVFELLKAVFVFEKLSDRAVAAGQEILNLLGTLHAVR